MRNPGMVEKTEYGVGVRSQVFKQYFFRLRLFHFMGHKVEKTESDNKRAQIVYNQV